MAVERAVVGRYMVGRSRYLLYALVKTAAWAYCAARCKCYARAVTEDEAAFLQDLARRMALPDGEAIAILVAIEALNRASLDG